MKLAYYAIDVTQGPRFAMARNVQRFMIAELRSRIFPQRPWSLCNCFRPIHKNNGGRKMPVSIDTTVCNKQIHSIA
jgi:hypothetical protein